MTQAPIVLEIFPKPPKTSQKQLLTIFWGAAIGLVIYEIYFSPVQELLSEIGAVLVTIAALIPMYLWCAGLALGIPVFPMFGLSFIWTYALPLINGFPNVMKYSPGAHLFAGATVAGFLALGTFIWYEHVKTAPKPPAVYRALQDRKGDQFFLAALTASVVFGVLNAARLLGGLGSFYPIVRSGALGLTAISTFVLCYRLGTRSFTNRQVGTVVLLIVSFMAIDALSFLLIGAASVAMVAIAAYTIGRKRVPIATIAVLFTILTFLNYGKSEMREKYWLDGIQPSVTPLQYVGVYSEWAESSFKFMQRREQKLETQDRSFSERASVVQMLLLAQQKSPETVPYLMGQTYAIIPQILVPRILVENRIRAQQGTHMLSIHYGLQTEEETLKTSISWGLLAEAYGNFGLFGCGGLAIVLGTFYGKATRWSINAPLLSLRSLFTVLLVTFAFQTEWTAGTYLAALAQTSYFLIGIALVFMENYRVPRAPRYFIQLDQ